MLLALGDATCWSFNISLAYYTLYGSNCWGVRDLSAKPQHPRFRRRQKEHSMKGGRSPKHSLNKSSTDALRPKNYSYYIVSFSVRAMDFCRLWEIQPQPSSNQRLLPVYVRQSRHVHVQSKRVISLSVDQYKNNWQ